MQRPWATMKPLDLALALGEIEDVGRLDQRPDMTTLTKLGADWFGI